MRPATTSRLCSPREEILFLLCEGSDFALQDEASLEALKLHLPFAQVFFVLLKLLLNVRSTYSFLGNSCCVRRYMHFTKTVPSPRQSKW